MSWGGVGGEERKLCFHMGGRNNTKIFSNLIYSSVEGHAEFDRNHVGRNLH